MTNELTDDELREAIVRHEWDQFQRTNNEGGRAACQGNWPVFHQMRLAQFLTWERPLLTSYAADLDAADHVGRNLVTEKYGRMMASTAPENFTKNIEPYIPRLSEERAARQEQVIAQQVAWAKDFRERYPKHHHRRHTICHLIRNLSARRAWYVFRPDLRTLRSDDWRARRSQPATQYH
jgi:hypothetical protein